MSKKAAIFIADGTEPIEAVAPADILRRGGVEVMFVSTMGQQVVMAHDVVVTAEAIIGEVDLEEFDMLIVPGGSVGVENLGKSAQMCEALKNAMVDGQYIGSICAGPMILNNLGLLEGRKATCYPSCERGFPEGTYVEGPTVVTDLNLVTGSGPGVALDFGIACLAALCGSDTADQVAKGMLLK